MSKQIVVFYSWSGNTRRIAELIAAQTGADLLELEPQTPYPSNYRAVVEQGKDEVQRGYRPALKPYDCNLTEYDTVYIGTPIWCGTMAPPLASFLSENSFEGKTVLPFCTHGGGGKGYLDQDVKKLCAGACIADICAVYQDGGHSAEKEISAWVK